MQMQVAKNSADLAHKNLHAEERKQELGAESAYFVLEAQTELAQAEASLVQAEVNYQQNLANLDHAAAGLLQRHHIQLSQ